MTINAGTDYKQIINLATGIYQNGVMTLLRKGIATCSENFRWRIGEAIHAAAVEALVMPEDCDEKTEVPYLFGCKVEWVYDNPWELTLLYDVTEI